MRGRGGEGDGGVGGGGGGGEGVDGGLGFNLLRGGNQFVSAAHLFLSQVPLLCYN